MNDLTEHKRRAEVRHVINIQNVREAREYIFHDRGELKMFKVWFVGVEEPVEYWAVKGGKTSEGLLTFINEERVDF